MFSLFSLNNIFLVKILNFCRNKPNLQHFCHNLSRNIKKRMGRKNLVRIYAARKSHRLCQPAAWQFVFLTKWLQTCMTRFWSKINYFVSSNGQWAKMGPKIFFLTSHHVNGMIGSKNQSKIQNWHRYFSVAPPFPKGSHPLPKVFFNMMMNMLYEGRIGHPAGVSGLGANNHEQ